MENIHFDQTWSLYLHYKDLGTCYNDNIEKLIDISDIITFWQTFNNIPRATDIFSDGINKKVMKRNNATPCAYSFFRKDIMPKWEDVKNVDGFEFSVKSSKNLYYFHDIWVNNIVELLTDKEEYSCINGIRIVDCTKFNVVTYRIEFWISDENIKDTIEEILKTQFTLNFRLMFKSHKNVKETT